jgi:NSS family neurotransmitter:Na+ symporter
MKQQQSTASSRAQFATRLGVIATTVGSAVGLGNIWRFPFEAGAHGGGAFMLCYLFFVFIIGVPVICSEFIMGRASRAGIFGAYRSLSGGRRWDWLGYGGILASVLIISFYSVVAGWTLEYCTQSVTGSLGQVDDAMRHDAFGVFTSGMRPLLWMGIFLIINGAVLICGVQKGIERMSNVLMPLLFCILLAFCINSLTLPAAADGLRFLFHPDFSQLTPSVVLGAMGQAFFSLSIGLGCMTTYASYFSDRTPLMKSATTIALLDTLVAILAGVMIFPAVFSFGMSPAEGPKLVFEVLPSIFNRLPMGMLWSSLFFFLLFLASLTSSISMSEIQIAFLCDHLHLKRRTATVFASLVAIALGSLCALSFGVLSDFTLFGMNIFSLFDFVSSNILMPLGGMMVSIFVGWRLDRKVFTTQLKGCGTLPRWAAVYISLMLRYVAPICIAIVFITGLL